MREESVTEEAGMCSEEALMIHHRAVSTPTQFADRTVHISASDKHMVYL